MKKLSTDPLSVVIHHLLADLGPDGSGMADGELLARFLRNRDDDALAALVRRHSSMVWGVCRRLLHHHDAEDAFQATFLVLIRKPADVPRQAVANWLYGVARQTAVRLRATAARRGRREKQVANMPEPTAPEARDAELQNVVDEELSRLPDHYRGVVVLCELEGMTRKQAARQLAIPEGSVGSRLARARAMLAKRLTRRGIVFSGGSVAAVLLAGSASACAPPTLVASTIHAASLLAAGKAAGFVSVQVAALTEGVLKAMLVTRIKAAFVVVLVLGFVATGAAIYASRPAAGPEDSKPAPEKQVEAAQGLEGDREKNQPRALGQQNENGEEAVAAGKAVAGLRLRLQPFHLKKDQSLPSHFVVVLENVGDTDLNVRLGYSLANGRFMHPAALRLIVLSKGNKARTLTYSQTRVAGRLDPLVVPLAAGSSYSLRCSFDKFADPDTGERNNLTAKDHRFAVELVGRAVTNPNQDMKGLALMPFWRGTARSNEVQALPLTGRERRTAGQDDEKPTGEALLGRRLGERFNRLHNDPDSPRGQVISDPAPACHLA